MKELFQDSDGEGRGGRQCKQGEERETDGSDGAGRKNLPDVSKTERENGLTGCWLERDGTKARLHEEQQSLSLKLSLSLHLVRVHRVMFATSTCVNHSFCLRQMLLLFSV